MHLFHILRVEVGNSQFTIPPSLAGGIVLLLVEHEDAAHGLHGDEGAHRQHQQHPEHAEDVVGALAARALGY